jgi:hypothetical protein
VERDTVLKQMQEQYARLCQELGQVTVQIKVLQGREARLLAAIQKLDEQAGLLRSATPESKV